MRFKRYTTEWTKINLSNYLFVSSKRNKDGRFSKEDVLSVSGELGIVNQIALLGRSYAGESVLPYHIVEKGDIVYTKSPLALYPYGIIKTNRNKVGIVSTLYAVYKTKDNANNRFIEHYFSLKSRINNYLKPIVRIGAKHDMKIGNNEVLENIVAFPDISEQCEIADFLDLLDNRISVQNKIISKYETLIKGIRERVVNGSWQWKKLDELIQEGVVRLNRGNIIPKHPKDNTYKYPVYSSSTQNNGLMGYNNTYMFDKELITWSIDGGGNFFYRKKHKFNVTNVCGIMQVDENVYSYRFIAEMLTYQHSKMKFDYQSKAHPSVISSLYSLPCLPISEQNSYCQLFIALDRKMQTEQCSLNKLKEQKKYLLSKMFI